MSGTVTFGGKPADNVLVTFTPSGSTKGRGGSSLTEASGKFAAVNSEKKVGLVAGEYVVTFSRWRTADGSLPPGDKPPIITGAQETIPATWREPSKAGTHNTVKIPDAGTSSIEFVVPSE